MDQHRHPHQSAPGRGLHRDWRTWVAVGVLLLAAGAYVLNLDRIIVPGGPAGGRAQDGGPAKP